MAINLFKDPASILPVIVVIIAGTFDFEIIPKLKLCRPGCLGTLCKRLTTSFTQGRPYDPESTDTETQSEVYNFVTFSFSERVEQNPIQITSSHIPRLHLMVRLCQANDDLLQQHQNHHNSSFLISQTNIASIKNLPIPIPSRLTSPLPLAKNLPQPHHKSRLHIPAPTQMRLQPPAR